MWKRKEHGWNYKSRIKILSPKSERFKDIFIWIFGKFRAASSAFACKRWSGKDIWRNMKHSHEMWENHLRLLGPECSDSWDFQAQLNLLPDFLWLCFIVFSIFSHLENFSFSYKFKSRLLIAKLYRRKGKFEHLTCVGALRKGRKMGTIKVEIAQCFSSHEIPLTPETMIARVEWWKLFDVAR